MSPDALGPGVTGRSGESGGTPPDQPQRHTLVKLLAQLYPPLRFGDYMAFHTPPLGAEQEWAKAALEEEADTADLLDIDDLSGVLSPYPAPGGLLVWGSSNQGDTFLWSTDSTSPQQWKVTVATHNGDWWHYTAGAVQFTADLIAGTLQPWGLPAVRPEVAAIAGGT